MKYAKRVIAFLLTLCMVLVELPLTVTAALSVTINEKNFPDLNFRRYLLAQDYGKDGFIGSGEMKDITILYISGYAISDLTGIEYFTELTHLYCDRLQLESLDLSKNTSLEYLSCRQSQLTRLNISECTLLQTLICSNNMLTYLNLSRNTALESLRCNSNQLKSLDVSENAALVDLWCDRNQLTELDVSGNTALETLYCDSNQLTNLDVSNNTALKTLDCNSNQLTNLDVSNNTALESLDCGSNQLTNLDVSNNTALEGLDCGSNQLTNLDVSNNTALKTLDCNSNQLTNLDVSNNTALESLDCGSNQLTNLDVSGNTAMWSLACYFNQLTSLDVSNNTALEHLYCGSNRLTNLDVDNNTVLERLDCGSNQLTNLNVSNNTALESLDCGSNQLTSLDLSNNGAMTFLACTDNVYTIELDHNNQFDLCSLPGNFDVSKISKRYGFSVSGNVLATGSDTTSVTYDYQVSDTETATFTLNCKHHVHIESEIIIENEIAATCEGGGSYDKVVYCFNCGQELSRVTIYTNTLNHIYTFTVTEPTCIARGYTTHTCISCGDSYTDSYIDALGHDDSTVKDHLCDFCNEELTACGDYDADHLCDVCSEELTEHDDANCDGYCDICSGVQINATNFPDLNFRDWILHQEYGADAFLTLEELERVTTINVSGYKIRSLAGIEFFVALTYLDCYNNLLIGLDLTSNILLRILHCDSNKLTSLNVSGNTLLEYLDCGDNQLTELDVSKNSVLKKLYCDNNQLVVLELGRNVYLTWLDCRNNQLPGLDVGRCTVLTSLYCGNNRLSSLDVSNNVALESLFCNNNLLTSLDITQNVELVELWCDYNSLTYLDVRQNVVLDVLHCYDNELTSLDLSRNTVLKTLYCYNNQLTTLDVSQNAKLIWLNCNNNQLTSLDVTNNPNLKYLFCYDNDFTVKIHNERQLPLSTLPGWFDVSKASEWTGGTVNGDILTVEADTVTYRYQVREGESWIFTLKIDRTHVEGAPVIENLVDSTCTTKGSFDEVVYCTVCKYEISRKMGTIDALGHAYGEPVIIWNEDNTATATVTCANDKIHVEEVEVAITSITTESDCETKAVTTYTAIVNFEGKTYSDIKLVEGEFGGHSWTGANCTNPMTCAICGTTEGDARGHDYGNPVFTWNEDNTATATVSCANDESHMEEIEVTLTNSTSEGDCETKVITTYTATVIFDGETYTDYKVVEGDYGNHKWGEVVDEDYKVTHADCKNAAVYYMSCELCGELHEFLTFTYGEALGHADNDADHSCDLCGESVSEHSDSGDEDYRCDLCGAVFVHEYSFPDSNFRAHILSQEYGEDGLLTQEELAQVSSIDVSGCRIRSLVGIEYFAGLRKLACNQNYLTSLELSNNTELESLSCDSNQLSNLDLSQNKALTYLACYGNQLTSLNVNGNTELVYLYCYDNRLTSLDLSGNTALKVLWCNDNELVSLNVSFNAELTELWCSGNQLTGLDVNNNIALIELYCEGNQLTELDVSGNTDLEWLACNCNQLSNLDVSQNTALKSLSCESNQLTSLDLSNNVALTELHCDMNQLTSLDVSENNALELLYCRYNTYTIALDANGQFDLSTLPGTFDVTKAGDWSGATVSGTILTAENPTITYTYQLSKGWMETFTLQIGSHMAGTVQIENEIAATCEQGGSYDEVIYCTICGETLSRNTVTVEALSHTLNTDGLCTGCGCQYAACVTINDGETVYCVDYNEVYVELASMTEDDRGAVTMFLDLDKSNLTGSFGVDNGTVTLDLNGCTIGKGMHVSGAVLTIVDTAEEKGTIVNYSGVAIWCYSGRIVIDASVDCLGESEGHEAWKLCTFTSYEASVGTTGSEDIVLPEGCVLLDIYMEKELTVLSGRAMIHRHADENTDHICDKNCKVPQGDHAAAEGSHDCEYCGETLSECIDENKDYVCDICGAELEKPDEVIRLAGSNRFDTAIKVADEMKVVLGAEKFDAIILANGYNFADALAGSYLSAVKNAPILLTWNGAEKYNYLNDATIQYVKDNLKPGGTVYILGGTAAVPASIDAALAQFNVERMDGANRFETNIMILEEAGVQPGSEVLVCTSTNFADSLSASAAAKPILLVWNEGGKLFDVQKEFLSSLEECSFTVIGGESAVSVNMAATLMSYGAVSRLAGGNRFETSVLVAEKYFSDATTAVLAYAWDFPDGLCGGALAYSMRAPLILTMTKYEAKAIEYVNAHGIESGVVLGGEKLISNESVRAIFAMDVADEVIVK